MNVYTKGSPYINASLFIIGENSYQMAVVMSKDNGL